MQGPRSDTDTGAGITSGQPDVPRNRRVHLAWRARELSRAIRDGDEATVEAAVARLSSRHRLLAPVGMVVGTITILFEGVRTLVLNWRLALVQILPAMWIWVAMFDLKLHAFHGKAFRPLHGWALIAAIGAATILTAGSFYLNAIFAFAIAAPGRPQIRPAYSRARSHAGTVIGWGAVIGLVLGVSAFYSDRWGPGWFAISMSVAIGILMLAYVAVPARLIGIKTRYSRTEKLKAAAVGGAIGGIVTTPPYALGRIGILMLASHILFVPGVILIAVAATLQAGATTAVKTVKMSAKLTGGQRRTAD